LGLNLKDLAKAGFFLKWPQVYLDVYLREAIDGRPAALARPDRWKLQMGTREKLGYASIMPGVSILGAT
jgi:hypothetical protein